MLSYAVLGHNTETSLETGHCVSVKHKISLLEGECQVFRLTSREVGGGGLKDVRHVSASGDGQYWCGAEEDLVETGESRLQAA